MKALSKKLIRDLSTLRIQILTMSLLISCGVAVLVASWSSYISLSKAQVEYYEKYRFADLFAELVRAPQAVIHQIQSIPGIENAEGRLVDDALLDLPLQPEPALAKVISFSRTNQINKVYLRQGRFPEKNQVLEVLVHESFAKAQNLHPGDFFYISIKAQKVRVQVSGVGLSPEYVYALNPMAPFPDDKHFGILWMNHEDLARQINMQGAFNSLTIQLAKGANINIVKSQIDQLIKPFGTLGTYDRSKQMSNLFVQDEIRQQKSMSYVVPTIFIVVASFILHTVISRLIGLHRTQIAALKSLGYHSQALVVFYWKLVTIILVLGIIPALFLAHGIGQWYAILYERYFRFPHIDFSLASEAILLGVIAGLLPGWTASIIALSQVFALKPAEAMRPPSPSKFTKSFFERWRWTTPRDLQSKMLLRNITAHPVRSLLSILGITAATAILINGSFWSDIIEYVVQRQFYIGNRADIDITFQHPRRTEVLEEIRRIPGVLMVEAARTVPVKILYRNINKETVIIATDSIISQKRIFNRHGEVLRPQDGLVILSSYFSKKYKLKKGDILTLELADRSHPNFNVTIGDFVDDLVGSSIYATSTDLHRWLSEVPAVNTVFATIDPRKSSQIYIKLKEYPEVISVSVKKLLYESFTATLSGMILTFTMILILFAVTISGAVLFNMARINFSEKSWELASLKILGFANPEVFRVLYLEIGFQVFWALLPGMILGYGLCYLSTQWIHTDTFNFPLVIDTTTYALAVVVIILTYAVTGIFMYRKVQSLSMTEALKARE